MYKETVQSNKKTLFLILAVIVLGLVLFGILDAFHLPYRSVWELSLIHIFATFSGLLVDFMNQAKANIIVKGLRSVTDFEYEFQIALLNKVLDANTETLFLMTNRNYSYISSSVVKDVAKYGGDLTGLLPEATIEIVKRKYKK